MHQRHEAPLAAPERLYDPDNLRLDLCPERGIGHGFLFRDLRGRLIDRQLQNVAGLPVCGLRRTQQPKLREEWSPLPPADGQLLGLRLGSPPQAHLGQRDVHAEDPVGKGKNRPSGMGGWRPLPLPWDLRVGIHGRISRDRLGVHVNMLSMINTKSPAGMHPATFAPHGGWPASPAGCMSLSTPADTIGPSPS